MTNLYVKALRQLTINQEATINIFGGKYSGIFTCMSGTKYLVFKFEGYSDIATCAQQLEHKYRLESVLTNPS